MLSVGAGAARGQARPPSPVLSLPVPLWCTVGNTEIKCRSEVGDEALSAGGHCQSLEYIPLQCSQTSCIRETTYLPAHPPSSPKSMTMGCSLRGLLFAEGCTIHTASLLR